MHCFLTAGNDHKTISQKKIEKIKESWKARIHKGLGDLKENCIIKIKESGKILFNTITIRKKPALLLSSTLMKQRAGKILLAGMRQS